jgi:hypothetical protein
LGRRRTWEDGLARITAGLLLLAVVSFAIGFAIARGLRDTPEPAHVRPVSYAPLPSTFNLDRATGFPKLSLGGAPLPQR